MHIALKYSSYNILSSKLLDMIKLKIEYFRDQIRA